MIRNSTKSVVIILALGFGIGLSVWQRSNQEPPAIAWQFNALHGGTIKQSDFTSDKVLINFWATWCPPCLRELPLIAELAKTSGESELSVLAVAYDEPKNIHQFLAEHPVELDIAHGFSDVKALMAAYGNESSSLPFSVLLDADGNILATHLGELLEGTIHDFVGYDPG